MKHLLTILIACFCLVTLGQAHVHDNTVKHASGVAISECHHGVSLDVAEPCEAVQETEPDAALFEHVAFIVANALHVRRVTTQPADATTPPVADTPLYIAVRSILV